MLNFVNDNQQEYIEVGCVPTARQRWPPLNVSSGGAGWGGLVGGPQVNMFEQVSSDVHQMSEARRKVPCPNASWVMVTWGPPHRMTDRHL